MIYPLLGNPKGLGNMWRIKVLAFVFILAFGIIWVRLFYWQVVLHDKYKSIAESQHFNRLTIPAIRGEILAADGTSLVANQPAYLVFAEKKHITDIEKTARTLWPLLDETEASIAAQLTKDSVWIPLKHHVAEDKVRAIKQLNYTAIGFEREDKRYYPESSMSAHLLGFVGKNQQGDEQGYFGIEGYYNKELAGINGYLRQEKDALGNPIVIGNSERIDPQNGRTLVLYLDKSVQFIAENQLKDGLKRYGAKAGNVIVMDPKTGGIIASTSYPSYDPGDFGQFHHDLYKNPIVADSFEPGSTFKALVMASAIDEGAVKATDTLEEKGPVHVSDYQIKTWNDAYHGTITMTEVLEYSSNVGMVKVSEKLGKDTLLKFLTNAGFGSPTGVDLEEESSPQLRPEKDWRAIDLATVSFGQGIAVTPLQMIRAIAAIANNGILMEPHAVKEIITSEEKMIPIPPKKVRQLFKPATAKIITEMMVSAVEHGEAKWAKPKEFRIAGKTGTAQIPVAGHYDDKKTIASFVGFAPADDPKFVMLVTLREPATSPWGSETAAPLFFRIAKELLIYYGVAPS